MKTTICVDDALNRLKKLVGVYSDAELARSLGLTASNISSWRRRKSLPYKKCIEVAAEHGVSLDWLLFGQKDSASDKPDLDPSLSQHISNQRSVRGRSSGFSDLRKNHEYPPMGRTTSDTNPMRLDPASVLPDHEEPALNQKHKPVLVDDFHKVRADLLRGSLRELLLMLHDAGTIDLRGTNAEAIADAFMGAIYRSMRETGDTGFIAPNPNTAP